MDITTPKDGGMVEAGEVEADKAGEVEARGEIWGAGCAPSAREPTPLGSKYCCSQSNV